MSTFKGFVPEFPDITIDYFRKRDENLRPPKACFLSHIHSDHLQGLEGTGTSCFIYCSAITEQLLLKLERREHRVNYARGIVERRDITYGKLAGRLKSIPLETPTKIELGLHEYITVTLFDANHCPGAVMFLIESPTASILYTGDIRAEAWWIESIKRHPVLIPYRTGLRKLNKIYLDTTFVFRKTLHEYFPPKEEGIAELLRKIERYPSDVVFHFSAWTWGYEDVWQAIATYFKKPIHVSEYNYKLLRLIRNISSTGPLFSGFEFKNTQVGGYLSRSRSCRFHSCDLRERCEGMKGKKVVYIKPIITRWQSGFEVEEAGVTNENDFSEHDQLSVDNTNLTNLLMLLKHQDIPQELVDYLKACNKTLSESIPLKTDGSEDEIDIPRLTSLLLASLEHSKKARLDEESRAGLIHAPSMNNIVREAPNPEWAKSSSDIFDADGNKLSHRITFPYSRHSSYTELYNLVSAFRPNDVYPCVTDVEHYTPEKSIERLFGDVCDNDGGIFAHDEEMRQNHPELFVEGKGEKGLEDEEETETQQRESYQLTSPPPPTSLPVPAPSKQRRQASHTWDTTPRPSARRARSTVSPRPSRQHGRSSKSHTRDTTPRPSNSQRTGVLTLSQQRDQQLQQQQTIDLTQFSDAEDDAAPLSSQRALSPKRTRRPALARESSSYKRRRMGQTNRSPEQGDSILIIEDTIYPNPIVFAPKSQNPSSCPSIQNPSPTSAQPNPVPPSDPSIKTDITKVSFQSEVSNVTMLPLLATMETPLPSSNDTYLASQAEPLASSSQGSCDEERIREAEMAALGLEGWRWGVDVSLKSLVRKGAGEVEL